MTTTEVLSPDLKTVLRRLRLSPILDTMPGVSPSPAAEDRIRTS
jgi:hypothetical protein